MNWCYYVALRSSIIVLLLFGTFILGLWYGGTQIISLSTQPQPQQESTLTINELIAVLYSCLYLLFSLQKLQPIFSWFETNHSKIKNLYQVCQHYYDINHRHHRHKSTFIDNKNKYQSPSFSSPIESSLSLSKNHIEFQNVTFSYLSSSSTCIQFKDINIKIPYGKVTLIHGAIGSGKSTIFKLIQKKVYPNKGNILINGIDINQEHHHQQHYDTSIGVVDAVPHFFNDTIYKNIAFGKSDFGNVTINQVIETCKLVGLHQIIHQWPLKYATVLHDQSNLLSSSEKKQLAIVRAIIQNPSILLLDEPTSSADEDLDRFLFDTILKTRKGKTTVIISHRLENILNRADHIIDMKDLAYQSNETNAQINNKQNHLSPANDNKSRRTIRQSMLVLLDNRLCENPSFFQTDLYGDNNNDDDGHKHSSEILYQLPSSSTHHHHLPRFDSLPSKSRYLNYHHHHNNRNGFAINCSTNVKNEQIQENKTSFKWAPYLWKYKHLYSTGVLILYIVTIIHSITIPYFSMIIARIFGYYTSAINKGSNNLTKNSNDSINRIQLESLIRQDLLLLLCLIILKSITTYFIQWYQQISVKPMVAQLQYDILSHFFLSTTVINNNNNYTMVDFSISTKNGNNNNSEIRNQLEEKEETRNTDQCIYQFIQKNPMVLEWFFIQYINELLVSSLIILVTLMIALLKCWKLTLFSFGILLPLIIVAFIIKRVGYQKHEMACKSKYHHANEILHEVINTKDTIQMLNLSNHFLQKMDKSLNLSLDQAYKLIVYLGIHFGLVQSIPYFTKVILFWYGTQLIIWQEYDTQSIIIVWVLLSFIIMCNSQVFSLVSKWSSAQLQFKDMSDILSTPSLFIIDHKHDTAYPTTTFIHEEQESICIAELFNVTLKVDNRVLLSNVSIRIPHGKFIGITGKSGSGKSLILQTLLSMDGITNNANFFLRGQILFNDQVPYSNKIIWRHMFSIVDQEPKFFPISIYDNIVLGTKYSQDVDKKQIEKVCQWVHLHDFILTLPNGYDTIIGESTSYLSHGQQRLLALARALVREPRLVLLDDITSVLDDKETRHIHQLLKKLVKEGQTILMISNHPLLLSSTDQVYVMENGKIIEKNHYSKLKKHIKSTCII
ncbi:unnamed protein product [Cunninghamella blakesleeana]